MNSFLIEVQTRDDYHEPTIIASDYASTIEEAIIAANRFQERNHNATIFVYALIKITTKQRIETTKTKSKKTK